MLRNNKDILAFQVINWGLNFVTFYIFLNHVASFKEIVQAEVMFGAIGAFLLFYSAKNANKEHALLVLRFALIALLVVCVFFFSHHKVTLFALISVLAVPAHLPIRLGFKKSIYPVLFGLKMLPLFLFTTTSEHALIYFLPNFLYGIFLYSLYYGQLDATSSENIEPLEMVLHFSSMSVLYFMQSTYVGKVMEMAPIFVLMEKLMRSAWGFVQPYILRKNPSKHLMQYAYGLFFVLLLLGAEPYVLFFIPVAIDSYLFFSGYKKRYDFIFLIISSVLVYTQHLA